MDRIGHCLQMPHWWGHEALGEMGRQSPLRSAVQLVVLVAGIPLFLAGLIVKKVHGCCGGRTFRNVGRGTEGGGSGFMQWNVCCMPGSLPRWFGGLTPASRRAKAIAKRILDEKPAVFALMEGYDRSLVSEVSKQLGPIYPNLVVEVGECQKIMGSGLIFGTTGKVVQQAFHRFTCASGFQKSMAKGFLVTDVVLEGVERRIIATHLQPGDSAHVRAAQIEQIRPYLKAECVVLGDLNIDRNTDEPMTLMTDSGVGNTCGKESVDYILGAGEVAVFPPNGSSDHSILVAR